MRPLIGKCGHCESSMTSKGEPFRKSYFTELFICQDCHEKDMEIKQKIVDKQGLGADLKYKGCGYIPNV